MKLIFLGTSHGQPELGRYCSSVYIEHKGHSFIVDLGAPIEYLLKNRGLAIEDIKAYFLTHMHADHAESLTSVAKAYAVYSPQKETDIFFAEEAAIEPYKAWQRALHLTPDTERVRLRVTMPGVIYENYGIKVSAMRTEHISKEIPTYAYIFESDEGKRVLFTGDLSNDFRDFPKVAKEEPFDVVVSELTHFSVDKAQPILREVKTKLMIFSHVSAWNISLLEKNNITFDFPHIVATDGFEYYVV